MIQLCKKIFPLDLALTEKKYFLIIQSEVIDGRIFLSGKVDEPEEKIKITKMAWETKEFDQLKMQLLLKVKVILKAQQKIF